MPTSPRDARNARYIDRRLGLYRARRRAWRRCGGDHAAFPAIMREEAAGYLYPYEGEPAAPPAESIGRALLRQCCHITAVCCVAAAAIIAWDWWPALSALAGW